MAEYYGTSGGDKLRGTSGDDIFHHSAGDDTYSGGDGWDVLVVDGSVHDYDFALYNRGWFMDHRYRLSDSYTGRDLLGGIEAVQFDEGTRIIGQEYVTRIEGPTAVSGYIDEVISYAVTITDLDDRVRMIASEYDKRISYGYATTDLTSGSQSTTGTISFDFEAVQSGPYLDLTYLAQDEALVVTHTMTFEATAFPDFDDEIYTHTVEITLYGLNDAPVMAPADGKRLVAREDGSRDRFNLASLGSDVDSDDTGRSLTYEIVDKTKGFSVWIRDHTLFLGDGRIDPLMTRDEIEEGTVTVRAVDRHGAVSNEVTLELLYRGTDDPVTRYVTGSGVDYDALGVDFGSASKWGLIYGWDPEPAYLDLLKFTRGDDVKVVKAQRIAWFDERQDLEDADGNLLRDGTEFDTREGSDTLVFKMRGGGFVGFEGNDVRMGDGEDVLALDLRASTEGGRNEAIVNGMSVSTGRNSDQVWISVAADNATWITGSVNTGSGHDIVEMRQTDTDRSTVSGHAFFDGGVSLGSGDDFFRYVNTSGRSALTAHMDVSVNAGSGRDTVILNNAQSRLAVPSNLPQDGDWADLYRGGLEGSVDMGGGRDTLKLNLNDPFPQAERAIAFLSGGGGRDTLVLRHLDAGDVTVSSLSGDHVSLTYRNQTLNIDGFEQILFADGSDFWDL